MTRRLSRRTLLRGTGAALALPWLDAMTPSALAAGKTRAKPPVRMAVLYMPNGVLGEMWTPDESGANYAISPTLKPLEDVRREVAILTNLWNQSAKGGDGHYVKTSGFLTCSTPNKTLGVDININGISMDQLAAQKLGGRTPLPSMELCTAPVTTGVDKNVGYTRVYGSHIAWGGPTNPLAREINPRLVFERLFRAAGPKQDSAKEDVLLLDRVMDDARQLRQELGTADRVRLDEYLSVVRSLEDRISRASNPERSKWKARAAIDPSAKPEGIPKDHGEHVRLMLDMIALAFQTDTTRIATFLFSNAVSNQNFSFVEGVNSGHHSVSHHQRDADKMRQYQIINRWHVEQYAYLLRKLRDMKEGSSSVLENSMILFGSGFRDGDKHDPHNLPLLLGGQGGGRIITGQHYMFSEDTPLANLYVSMLDAFGMPLERFADSTGPLTPLVHS
jgi:hypothetical protein